MKMIGYESSEELTTLFPGLYYLLEPLDTGECILTLINQTQVLLKSLTILVCKWGTDNVLRRSQHIQTHYCPWSYLITKLKDLPLEGFPQLDPSIPFLLQQRKCPKI